MQGGEKKKGVTRGPSDRPYLAEASNRRLIKYIRKGNPN